MNAFKSYHGFTLIELVIVIVILGVLSAFIVPRFAELSDSAVSASFGKEVSSFVSALNGAHSYWYVQNKASSISIDNTTVTMSATGWPNGVDGSDTMNDSDCQSLWNALMNTSHQEPAVGLTASQAQAAGYTYLAIGFDQSCVYFDVRKIQTARFLLYSNADGAITIQNPNA